MTGTRDFLAAYIAASALLTNVSTVSVDSNVAIPMELSISYSGSAESATGIINAAWHRSATWRA